jgi:cobalt/nickel transport system ATP-binding protein
MDIVAVEIKGLSFCYPDGTKALEDINITIFKGESVGIIGPNGAGKSTFLLHLNGILRGEGLVRVFGMDVNNGNLKNIRKKVGMVFQDPDSQLFCPTLFDDVAFGPLNCGLKPQIIKDKVASALESVNLRGFEERSPHHLSLGEKKRAALATVLSMEPEMIVLDEPTSNLDPRSKREIIQLLKGFNITKIIASHDMDLIWQICDRVILLNKGRKIEDADTSLILQNDKLLLSNGL